MSTGSAPEPPDVGWTVLYQDALRVWLATEPSLLLVPLVIDWVRTIQVLGPPPDGIPVGGPDDLHLGKIDDLTVGYLVIEYERLVIVKDFTA